jgi:hypothetical protein
MAEPLIFLSLTIYPRNILGASLSNEGLLHICALNC